MAFSVGIVHSYARGNQGAGRAQLCCGYEEMLVSSLLSLSLLLTTPPFPKLTFELKVQKVSGLTGVTHANQRPKKHLAI